MPFSFQILLNFYETVSGILSPRLRKEKKGKKSKPSLQREKGLKPKGWRSQYNSLTTRLDSVVRQKVN